MGRSSMALQFSVGQKAVYPAHGVGEIVEIEEKEISGKIHRFYRLRILSSDMMVLIPLQNAEKVGLRAVVSELEVQEIFEVLRSREYHCDKQTWNRRYRGFLEKVRTGSLFEVAEVFRDLYRLRSTKTLCSGERRMLDTVRGLIVSELAIAKSTTESDVEEEITQLFAA